MPTEKQHLFDNPNNIRRVLSLLYVVCILLFILDFFVHRHLMHRWEGLLGFYAVYGFVGCVVLVLIAKWMRTFLMREEDYYDRGESVTENREGGEHVGR
jgi:hypothetical protein